MEKKTIKILLCSPKNGIGGITMWTSHILDYFKNNKNNVIIKWCYSNNTQQTYTTSNIFFRLYHGLVNYIPFIHNLRKEIKKNNYDIVHFTTSASISLLRDIITLRICRRKKIKTVVHFHFGRIPQIFKSNNWEKKLINKVISLSDWTIVIDNASYNTLKADGFVNVSYLPNPLSPKVSDIICNNHNTTIESRKIVFVGHVIPTKGVYELVQACRNISNIQLNIIGPYSDEIKNKLYELAGQEAKDWLKLIGNLPFEEVIKEMLSANLFVLPTYTEGFPNVILESMACGCAIITTPVGAIPEMLDIDNCKACGKCVGVGNIENLKENIEYYLQHKEESFAMGMRAKERVNKIYSIDNTMEQLIKIWRTIVS